MHSQIIVGEPVRRPPGTRRLRAAAQGVALVLVVAAGLGALRGIDQRHTSEPSVPAGSQVAGDARPAAPARTTVYLVSSPAQAEAIRSAIAEADAFRSALHTEPLDARVLVVEDDIERQAVRIIPENHSRDVMGQPLIQVVDLRGP
jgi:hypothetical protein